MFSLAKQPPLSPSAYRHLPFREVRSNCRPYLYCIWSDAREKLVTIPTEGRIAVGGDLFDQIRIDTIYGTHTVATIQQARIRYYVQVFDSQVPVQWNGRKISDATRLQNGDTVQVGDVSLRFYE